MSFVLFILISVLFSYFILCMLVCTIVRCIDNEQFEGFPEGEGFEDSE